MHISPPICPIYTNPYTIGKLLTRGIQWYMIRWVLTKLHGTWCSQKPKIGPKSDPNWHNSLKIQPFFDFTPPHGTLWCQESYPYIHCHLRRSGEKVAPQPPQQKKSTSFGTLRPQGDPSNKAFSSHCSQKRSSCRHTLWSSKLCLLNPPVLYLPIGILVWVKGPLQTSFDRSIWAQYTLQ